MEVAKKPVETATEKLAPSIFVVDFPVVLRNDLIYCQNALREYIKIHQVFCRLISLAPLSNSLIYFPAVRNGVNSGLMGKSYHLSFNQTTFVYSCLKFILKAQIGAFAGDKVAGA